MQKTFQSYINQNIPFLFIIDFEQKKPIIIPIDEAARAGIFFSINGKTNFENESISNLSDIQINKSPISFSDYKKSFDLVQKHILEGNSYLVNLTFPTEIKINASLFEIFQHAEAKYKLFYKNQFLVFSPESFVKINNQKIYSFPMKGTIDANLPNAKNQILNNPKEKAEHNTIVDLIRNDLGIITEKVRVDSFRYVERINTNEKDLLQVSSRISGNLESSFQQNLAEKMAKILPAGSVSGAPKKKTKEIIAQAEIDDRGYYTGIFGYYENGKLDSGVMIRFIEKKDGKTFFRSGGGITAKSNAREEYQELIDKIYIPIHSTVRNNQLTVSRQNFVLEEMLSYDGE